MQPDIHLSYFFRLAFEIVLFASIFLRVYFISPFLSLSAAVNLRSVSIHESSMRLLLQFRFYWQVRNHYIRVQIMDEIRGPQTSGNFDSLSLSLLSQSAPQSYDSTTENVEAFRGPHLIALQMPLEWLENFSLMRK